MFHSDTQWIIGMKKLGHLGIDAEGVNISLDTS